MQNTENNSRCKKNPRQTENFSAVKIGKKIQQGSPSGSPEQVWYGALHFTPRSIADPPAQRSSIVGWNSGADSLKGRR
jgi:hypothetical protein